VFILAYSTRLYSNKQEKEVAKKVKGSRVPNSGAAMFYAGDVITQHFLIECKTKIEDIIPISDEALQLIGYSPEKTGLVFKGLKRCWTQYPMKEWIRAAGITKNITFHSYRRTFATLQAAAGTDIRTIQSIMAHKSITTTQRYMKVVDSNKRKASNKISLIRKN
jgi:integrase